MTLVPASSHGSTFSGGTITNALDIAPATVPAGAVLELDAPAGFGNQNVLEIHPDAAHFASIFAALGLDANAELLLQSNAGPQEAKIAMTDNVHSGEIDLSTQFGVSIFPGGGANFFYGLYISPNQPPHAATVRLDAYSTQTVPILNASGNLVSSGYNSDGNAFTRSGAAGALATTAFVSGTAKQVDTGADRLLVVPVTYNPGVATTATCKVELSPDNTTFSTLVTITQPVGTVFDGLIEPVTLLVPAAWYVKLTVTNATLGTGTYY